MHGSGLHSPATERHAPDRTRATTRRLADAPPAYPTAYRASDSGHRKLRPGAPSPAAIRSFRTTLPGQCAGTHLADRAISDNLRPSLRATI